MARRTLLTSAEWLARETPFVALGIQEPRELGRCSVGSPSQRQLCAYSGWSSETEEESVRRLRRQVQICTGYVCKHSGASLPEGQQHNIFGCEIVYSLPSSPNERKAAAEQRHDRHRRREELKLRQLEQGVIEMLDVEEGECEALLSHIEKQRQRAQNARESKRARMTNVEEDPDGDTWK